MSEEKTKLPSLQAGGKLAPIVPQSFDDVYRIAKVAVASGLFKGQSGDQEAQAIMAIMKGMEIGIQPMQALENITIINGRSQIWGDLVPALVWSNGHKIKEWYEGSGTDLIAKCAITRHDNGEVIEREFSVTDAQEAELWGKGTWKKYPKRMLQMRARGFAARDGIPDVLKGMVLREEMEGLEGGDVIDITPRDFTPPPPPADLATEPATNKVEPTASADELLANLDESLGYAQDMKTLKENWDDAVETRDELEAMSRLDDVRAILDKHKNRLNPK